jgi:hypothetical protein
MTDWNQPDSQEKLMRYLLRPSDAIGDPCPDPESLIAFSERILNGAKCELIQAHLDSCTACSEIHRLLAGLDDADALLSESEWQKAEKRLGNWMESFLPAESAASQVDQTHHARLWERFSEWIRIRPFRYALAATTALVLLAGISLQQLYRMSAPDVASVVQQQKISPPKTGQQPSPTTEIRTSRPKEIQSAVSAFQEQKTSHSEAAQQSLPIIEIGSSRPKEIQDLTPASANGSQAPELTAALGISAVPLITMQIEVGTGIVVRVGSVFKNPAGSSTFRGSLIQPLLQGGKEVLPANSIVVADGQVSGREIVLRIAEIRARFAQSSSEHRAGITRYFLSPSENQPNVRAHLPESPHELSPGATIELRFVTSSSYLSEIDRPR